MNFKFFHFLVILILFFDLPENLLAQNKKNIESEICNKIFNFEFQYTYQTPEGYLASRYNYIHNVGFGGIIKSKDNWLYGIMGSYQYGTNINQDVSQNILLNISNSSGIVSNNSGSPGMVLIGEHGISTFLKGGKVFSIGKSNPNSGIAILLGVGFLAHKISITTPENNIPTLTDDLKKGYDRLTMGFALNQFVGYYFQGKNRMTNFYLGVDIIEGFTKNTRGFNYDTRQSDTGSHFDIFVGPKLCWMIPIYLSSKKEDEFYYK